MGGRSRHPFRMPESTLGYWDPASANWRICPTSFGSSQGRVTRAPGSWRLRHHEPPSCTWLVGYPLRALSGLGSALGPVAVGWPAPRATRRRARNGGPGGLNPRQLGRWSPSRPWSARWSRWPASRGAPGPGDRRWKCRSGRGTVGPYEDRYARQHDQQCPPPGAPGHAGPAPIWQGLDI